MKKNIMVLLISILVMLPIFIFSAPQKEIKMSLTDCIQQALEKNIALNIETVSYEESKQSLKASKGLFIPELNLSYSRSERKNQTSSLLEGADVIESESDDYSASISETLPIGGTFTVTTNFSRDESNSTWRTINPMYNSQLNFQLTQPLLKDFGFKATKKNIIIASNNKKYSMYGLKNKVMETIYNVENAYWDLVYARMNLKVQQEALNSAKKLLDINQKKVKVGTIPPMDVLSAKSEVASKESEIIEAKASIEQAEDELKRLLNVEKNNSKWEYKITPTDEPETSLESELPSFEEAIKQARENDPGIKQLELTLKNRGIDVSYQKNQLLPTLNLNARYWTTGMSGTQKKTEGFPPTVIEIIEKDAWESMKDALKGLYNNWSISVELQIPLWFSEKKANLAVAKLQRKQALLNLKSAEQEKIKEIRQALRDVQAKLESVEARKVATELASQQLEAEEKKFVAGMSTNYNVLQARETYETNRSSEVNAIINLNKAILTLKRAMGTLLDDKEVKFEENWK